jgi:hypothetical protein
MYKCNQIPQPPMTKLRKIPLRLAQPTMPCEPAKARFFFFFFYFLPAPPTFNYSCWMGSCTSWLKN